MASWSSSKDPNLSSKADDRDPNDLPLQRKKYLMSYSFNLCLKLNVDNQELGLSKNSLIKQ